MKDITLSVGSGKLIESDGGQGVLLLDERLSDQD